MLIRWWNRDELRRVSPHAQRPASIWRHRLTVFVGAAVLIGATAGCDAARDRLGGQSDELPTPSSASQPVASTVAPLPTTTQPTTTAVSDTDSPATEPSATGSSATDSSVGGQTSAPVTAPGSTDPGGTVPVYQEELVLSPSGLGSQPFGSDPEEVIQYVSSVLGSPTDDTGWVEATEHPDCPGTMVRNVAFGVLGLQFSDSSPIKETGNHFLGWTYGSVVEIGESPEGLHTDVGVGVGTPLGEVLAAYPSAVVEEGDPDTAYPDSFFVDNGLWGLLSGPSEDDVTTRLASEYGCGN